MLKALFCHLIFYLLWGWFGLGLLVIIVSINFSYIETTRFIGAGIPPSQVSYDE
jgi:hypothetical protein